MQTNKKNQSQKILDAAFKCISKKGYANVSLRDIANEADVVLSQLNYYYKNKDGLFLEVINTLKPIYLNQIEECLKHGETAKDKMACLMRYWQTTLKNDPELFKVIYDFTNLGMWSLSFRTLLNSIFNELSILIEKYIIKNISPQSNISYYSKDTLTKMLISIIHGTAIQTILNPENENAFDNLTIINNII